MQVLQGYKLIRKLGSGGMGVVYEAETQKTGRRVALKTIPAFEPTALYLLKREFRSLADLDHPNLVHLHELVGTGEFWFYTMELLEGVDFFRYLRPDAPESIDEAPTLPDGTEVIDPGRTRVDPGRTKEMAPGTLDEERLRNVAGQLAAGVHALHEAGRMHRDLKPSNTLVDNSGLLKILDFGLVALMDDDGQQTNRLMGTVPYMAPEQAGQRALTSATDWYAVGVMLFEVLTGKRPIPGKGLEVLWRKQAQAAPSPRSINPWIPKDLDALVSGLLQRDPAARPRGEEVLRVLGGRASSPGALTWRAPPVLIGRGAQLQALAALAQRAREGSTEIAVVHGTSGVGKSALVQRFIESQRRQKVQVLRGRCYAQEAVPYKGLDSLIDAISHYLSRLPKDRLRTFLPRTIGALSRLFPVLEGVIGAVALEEEAPDAALLLQRATGALKTLLQRLSTQHPCCW